MHWMALANTVCMATGSCRWSVPPTSPWITLRIQWGRQTRNYGEYESIVNPHVVLLASRSDWMGVATVACKQILGDTGRLGRRVGINTEKIPSDVLSLPDNLGFFFVILSQYLNYILILMFELNDIFLNCLLHTGTRWCRQVHASANAHMHSHIQYGKTLAWMTSGYEKWKMDKYEQIGDEWTRWFPECPSTKHLNQDTLGKMNQLSDNP